MKDKDKVVLALRMRWPWSAWVWDSSIWAMIGVADEALPEFREETGSCGFMAAAPMLSFGTHDQRFFNAGGSRRFPSGYCLIAWPVRWAGAEFWDSRYIRQSSCEVALKNLFAPKVRKTFELDFPEASHLTIV